MKTSIAIDEDLWERVKEAARAWAEQESLPPEGMTSKWISKQLKESSDIQLSQSHLKFRRCPSVVDAVKTAYREGSEVQRKLIRSWMKRVISNVDGSDE